MSDDNNGLDPKFFNQMAQGLHVLMAYSVVMTVGYLWGLAPIPYILIVLVFAAAIKEFWYDYHYEDTATRGSSFLDFMLYILGTALGASVILLHTNGLL